MREVYIERKSNALLLICRKTTIGLKPDELLFTH